MACRKPVICRKLDGVYRAAGDKVLYASSHDEYGKHLLALYDNRELRERMGAEGVELVQKHYRWDNLLARLENVLTSRVS